MTSVERTELWRNRMADYQASGLRVSDWCKQHGVTPKQLYYWKRKFKNEEHSGKPSWISLLADEESNTASLLVVKIGSASIEVQPGFQTSLLADVVKVLKSIC